MNTAAPTALQPTEPTAADVGTLRLIALDHVHPSPMNPRKAFDPVKLKELGDSIRAKGIIEPIIARPHPTKGDGHVEIAAGERRWRASKLVKHLQAPVIVRQLTDAAMVEIMTIENLQRDNLQPMEEADGYALLQEKSGYDVPMIAEKIGKSPSYVHQRLKLRELGPKARAALVEGKITPGHAIYIARLQPKDQDEALAACFNWQGLVSTKELGRWIHDQLHLEIKGAPFDTKDAKLLPVAGPCSTCPKRSGANPDLFGDVERDSCTDRSCWGGKVKAHLDAKRADLKAKGAFVEISTDYRQPAKGVLARGMYTEAKKGDPKAVTALVSEGADVGKVITVRVGKPAAPKRHPQSSRSGGSDASDAKRKEKLAAEEERQRRIWAALYPKLPKTLDLARARAWAEREFGFGEVRDIARALGVTVVGNAYNSAEKALRLYVAKVPAGDMVRVVNAVLLTEEGDKAVLAAAKTYGVNIAAIDREIAAAETAKAKAVTAEKGKTKLPAKAAAKKQPAKKAKKK